MPTAYPGLLIPNKFTHCYFYLVDRAQRSNRVKRSPSDPEFVYYERHHVIPRALGGSNDAENLVLLTPREHFVCHWLLTHMCEQKAHRRKMLLALRLMTTERRDALSVKSLSAIYDKSKAGIALAVSENNQGRKRSPEVKAKLAGSTAGDRNPMWGRTHGPSTVEKMADAKRGNRNPNASGLSENHRAAIGRAHKGKTIPPHMVEACRTRSVGNSFARKSYRVTMSDGSVIVVTNREEFCRSHGIQPGTFSNAAKYEKTVKGMLVQYHKL